MQTGRLFYTGELEEIATRIAATIQAHPEFSRTPLTAVLASRSPTAFAGILGTLLAGNGYVPLNFPVDRIRLMFERSESQSIIVDTRSLPNLRSLLERARNALLVILPELHDVGACRAQWPFANQCNFGLAQVESEWVLSLDADYEISDGLVAELSSLRETEGVVGYRASFIYRIYGRPLRGTLYPPRIVLYRVKNAHYTNEGHGHQVNISGDVRALKGVIYHDDRKPLSRWFTAQQSYAKLEADYLLKAEKEVLSVSDRLRLMAWPAPIAVFFYVLVVKGCLFDGWRGWFYALQRTLAESMIALQLIDRRLRRERSQD